MQYAKLDLVGKEDGKNGAGLWKTLWKMESLTETKVYVRSKHLSIPQVLEIIFLMHSMTYASSTEQGEIVHRCPTPVHNCSFPVKNLIALQHNVDATLEEIS